MLTFLEIAQRYRPRWVVWENVPGVLSSNGGRDFGAFLGALGELGYRWAYRVLDAQWFGVAQRRRRVFVVGCLGDERRAAAVLFESESVRRDNPPSRAQGEESAAGFANGTARGGIAKPLGAHSLSKGRGADLDNTTYVAFHPTQDPISSEDDLVHALGTGLSGGCATAAVAFTKAKRAQSTTDDESWVPGEVAPTFNCFDQGDTRATTVVAYDVHGTLAKKGASETDVHTALRSRSPGQSEASTTTVVAFSERTRECGSHLELEQTGVCPAIKTGCNRQQGVLTSMAVRRLTPMECERLQGFPDHYTAIEYRKKPAADGPRYKALGNSMAVPVMRWIGQRIAMVNRLDAGAPA